MKPLRQKAVSIHEIARLAKVSASTVSRVLNDGQVSKAKRSCVEKIIKKVGYFPDGRAAGLRRGRTQKIGLIIPRIDNPVYSTTVCLIHNFLRNHSYSLLPGITYGSAHEEGEVLDLMRRECVDGVILNTCEGEDDANLRGKLLALQKQGTPLVFIGKDPGDVEADLITVDNDAGVLKLVSYLHNTGRSRIGLIVGREGLYATQTRVVAFRNALEQIGLPFVSDNVMMGDEFSIEDGQRLAQILIKRGQVDALVCGNDLMAVGALRAAKQCGVQVPNDMAITGFDDIELASLVSPNLTTIHQPFETIAHKACERMLLWLAGKVIKGEHFLLTPELIIREST